MTFGVGGFPDHLAVLGGELVSYRAAEDCAALVALAVGAHQQQRVVDALATGGAGGAEVEIQQRLGTGDLQAFEDGSGVVAVAFGPADVELPGGTGCALLAFAAGAADELQLGAVVLEELLNLFGEFLP